MLPHTPRTFVGSTVLTVHGLRCRSCREAVVGAAAAVPGVTCVTVHPATGTITVSVDRPVDRADITAALEGAGHTTEQ